MRNEDFEGERNIAFKRGQNQTCLNYAERSNEKELNDERALLESFFIDVRDEANPAQPSRERML